MKLTTEYLDKCSIEYTVMDRRITIGGSLDLEGTQITALPDNLTVGGSLNLEGTQITALPDNLTVGGSLDLSGTQVTSLPDNLTVGGYLDLSGTPITGLPDNLTVGGSFYLRGTQVTSLPDNLTVGGSLDLRGTQVTSLPDNLTVGGWLDLEGTQITALPDNLTVGGYLDLRGTQITQPKKRDPLPDGFRASIQLSIEVRFNAKGFTIADGILARILQTRGPVKKILIVGRKEPTWLASDDKGNYAHGATIKEALFDLRFKTEDRDVSEFENMPLDTVKTPEDWAIVYHICTGACSEGTRIFMQSRELKESYTLAEIIKETKGAYGHDRFVETVSG